MGFQRCSFAACTGPVFAVQLCRRHYGRQRRHGTPGCPTCRQRDLAPHQRQCLECIAADFCRLGHDPLDITAYRSSTAAIMCWCLTCGTVTGKQLGNLRTFGPQCAGCYAPVRAMVAARSRFTQEQAAQILDRAEWTLRGRYQNANTPVEATCQGCGTTDKRRVGDTHAKLKEGTRQFGCMACVRKKFPHPRTVPLEQAIQEFRDEGIDYLGGWTGEQHPVDARCAECGHMFRPSLKHLRAGARLPALQSHRLLDRCPPSARPWARGPAVAAGLSSPTGTPGPRCSTRSASERWTRSPARAAQAATGCITTTGTAHGWSRPSRPTC